ncbi:MAG TPA: 16S rRNA (cytidine(1402)-2'-O)-methyltransferase [Candidatus Gastranaerophilaceae bacterium]|nr:16S rRNA (cytidine(1402)-2'-O)-methyltransferase [Candidatus Gastranaerophilaceae bacterium]HPT40754.1 16S rRNA (cytidine(1402)-2'-O)-methyltransferase [Candidatus Gastranaerophilaceae bacterium]
MKKEFQLYIVPTPIGNIEDVTLRAIDILKSVDIIACEDSRITQKLLYRYDIKTKLISYHKFNEKQRVNLLLKLLKEGKKIALVSDAGTPLISDPGSILISELGLNGINFTALPGACAVPTFLSQVPRDGEDFAFIGFLPKTKGQIFAILQKFAHTNLVFYESPNRLLKTLEGINEFNPKAKVAVGRELTKVFEEIVIDKVQNVIEYYKANPLKGEIVVMVYKKESTEFCQTEILEKIELLKRKKFGAKDISTILAELYDLNKNDIYKIII